MAAVAEVPPLESVPCNLCGSERFTVIYARCPDRRHWLPGRFDIVSCDGCALVQTNPRPSRAAISGYYPESYSSFSPDESVRGPVYSVVRTLVRIPYHARFGRGMPLPRPTRSDSRVLDIGCGPGLLLGELARLGWEPWAVEPNRMMAQRAANRVGIPRPNVFVGPAEHARFERASFDLVTMSHVLEHLHDPLAVLQNIRDWLRPGGELRLWIPDFGSLERRLFGRYWMALDVPRHLYHFTRATLGVMLGRAGFTVGEIVPEWQGNIVTSSVTYFAEALRGRRSVYGESRALHYTLLPLVSILQAAGGSGVVQVAASLRDE